MPVAVARRRFGGTDIAAPVEEEEPGDGLAPASGAARADPGDADLSSVAAGVRGYCRMGSARSSSARIRFQRSPATGCAA